MTKMFTDAIEFLNNIGDTHKAFINVKENNVDLSQLTHNMVNIKLFIHEHKIYLKENIFRLIYIYIFF